MCRLLENYKNQIALATCLRLRCASTHSADSPFSCVTQAGNRAPTLALAGSTNPRQRASAMFKRLTTTASLHDTVYSTVQAGERERNVIPLAWAGRSTGACGISSKS